MTLQEESRIVELHTKWGNRWSKIARKLPGRTDNEIKNYWRTHMRKKAQEKKRALSSSLSPSPSVSSLSAYSSVTSNPTVDSLQMSDTAERSFCDNGGLEMITSTNGKGNNYDVYSTMEGHDGYNSMDEIWKDLSLLDDDYGITSVYGTYGDQIAPYSLWDYPHNTLWMVDGPDHIGGNMFFPDNKRAI